MDKVQQADLEAKQRLDEWNAFIDRALDGNGFVEPGERQKVLLRWAEAENRAGRLRRLVQREGGA